MAKATAQPKRSRSLVAMVVTPTQLSKYKPATATVQIKVEKAPVNVTIDNQVIKYGDSSNNLPVSTDPAGVDTIQFIIGLNVSGLNYDGGIKGFEAGVQLLLPESLQSLLETVDDYLTLAGLDISFANGATMRLSDLKEAVGVLNEYLGDSGYAEYFRVLINMIDSIPTDVADIAITIGGTLPTDVGVYLIGAVTADANYETAFGVGVIAIYPDGIKADLAWNQNDDNYIITNSLIASGAFDVEAHAVAVGAGGTLADATANITEFFIGVDIDGNIIMEANPAKLNVGAYIEIAAIFDWAFIFFKYSIKINFKSWSKFTYSNTYTTSTKVITTNNFFRNTLISK